jgi:hypothetical protein
LATKSKQTFNSACISIGAPSLELAGNPLFPALDFRLLHQIYRRAHLVHPGEAISPIAADDEPGLFIERQLDVEPLLVHASIDFEAGPPLSELDSNGVRLENVLNDIVKPHDLELAPLELLVMSLHVVVEEAHLHLGFEESRSVDLGVVDVVPDGLDEPPGGVPGVVPGVLALVEQVGDKPVAQGAGEHQNDVAGLVEVAGDEQDALEGHEGVAAPAAGPAGGEVRQPGGHGGAELLHFAGGDVVHELVARKDQLLEEPRAVEPAFYLDLVHHDDLADVHELADEFAEVVGDVVLRQLLDVLEDLLQVQDHPLELVLSLLQSRLDVVQQPEA